MTAVCILFVESKMLFTTLLTITFEIIVLEYNLRKGGSYPQSAYDELDPAPHLIPRTEHFRITPSPGAVTDRYGK